MLLKGEVTDFAGDLCEIIVDILGLSQRGDLVAKISPLLFTLNSDRGFYQYLKKFKEFCGIFESDNEIEIPDEIPGAENGSKEGEPGGYFEDEEKQIANRNGEEIESNIKESDLVQNIGYSGNKDLEAIKGIEEKPSEVLDKDHDIDPIDHAQIKRKRLPQKGQSKKRIDRIVTYVFPKKEFESATENPDSNTNSERVRNIGKTAENHVFRIEEEDGRKPKLMPINHPGYDLESYGNSEDDIRYIEVKGIDGDWTDVGVGISSRQYEEAVSKGDSYWLYIVENALSEKPIVHRLNNPVAAISNYRFDSNWRIIAGATGSDNPDLFNEKFLEGSRVIINEKPATIIKVQNSDKLSQIRVRFDDGQSKIILDKSKIRFLEQ